MSDNKNGDGINVTISSPTGKTRSVTMYEPWNKNADGTEADALMLRRYAPPLKPDKSDAWTTPDDHTRR